MPKIWEWNKRHATNCGRTNSSDESSQREATLLLPYISLSILSPRFDLQRSDPMSNKNLFLIYFPSHSLNFQETIEAKNHLFIELKNQVSASSSNASIYKPEDIDLSQLREINSPADSSEYPFYNPLFGSQFESLYRWVCPNKWWDLQSWRKQISFKLLVKTIRRNRSHL